MFSKHRVNAMNFWPSDLLANFQRKSLEWIIHTYDTESSSNINQLMPLCSSLRCFFCFCFVAPLLRQQRAPVYQRKWRRFVTFITLRHQTLSTSSTSRKSIGTRLVFILHRYFHLAARHCRSFYFVLSYSSFVHGFVVLFCCLVAASPFLSTMPAIRSSLHIIKNGRSI